MLPIQQSICPGVRSKCLKIQNGGGGIFVNSGSTFNLSGGKIINNFTYGENGGGGIYAQSEEAIINLSGAPVITGNMFNEQENNLWLRESEGAKANIVGPLTYGAKIGVTLYHYKNGVRDSVTGAFTTGYFTDNTADPSKYFFADNAKFTVGWGESDEAEVLNGTYTLVYVGLDGTETEKEFSVGEELTLESVTAEEGKVGGWTLTEGGTSIDYAGGQTFADGLGKAHGEVITLYAVQVRDIASDVDGVIADLEDAVEGVNAALEGGSAADLQGALEALIKAYEAADTALASDFAAADTNLKTELEKAIGEAKTALQASIDAVQTGLEEAVKKLEEAIAAGDEGASEALAEAVADLTAAYQNADVLIEADIAALESADKEIEGQISSLQEELQAADEALGEALDSVEAQLKEAVEALQALYAEGEAPADLTLAAGMKELVAQLQAYGHRYRRRAVGRGR